MDMVDRGRAALLVPGRTCWRVERATRMTVVVDAADYFAAAKQAIARARHSVLLVGWDFDTRIRLDPRHSAHALPDELFDFLAAVVRRNPNLMVRILKWDLSVLKMPVRGRLPLLLLDLISDGRMNLRLDAEHPTGASHHQKIVVVDDSVAFAGGIDMTTDRWDTSDHLDKNPMRVRPGGRPYPPWHDATVAVEGPAARALGDLARERWERATGEHLEPAGPAAGCWPSGLTPQFRDIDVAIARTAPPYKGRPAVREVEALWLAALEGARRLVYIEQQYFAAPRVAAVIERRLLEEDGPEVVVVAPYHHMGWLEAEAMGGARRALLERVRRADRHGRFRIYAPLTAGGDDIYVHAKVLVVDDRVLRVGSSNMNNRSMGLDTECDLAIEATNAEDRDTVRDLRLRLVAEHLGREPEEVAEAERRNGSLGRAVDELRRRAGRTLVPIDEPDPSPAERALVEERLLDQDRPEPLAAVVRRGATRFPQVAVAVGVAAAALGIGGLWLAARAVRRSRSSGRAVKDQATGPASPPRPRPPAPARAPRTR